MTIARDAQYVAELATRIANAVTLVDRHNQTVLDRMRDSMSGHPRAASWDNGPRETIVWCDRHECDVRMCHRESWGCTGVPLVQRSDPTGDAALTPDIAAIDLKNLARALHRMVNDADLIVRIVGDYPAPGPANAYQRQQTADPNAPHCESCARHHVTKGVPWMQDVYDKCPNRTTVGDILTEPMYLCRFCYDHAWSRGCLPNLDELKFRETYQGQDRRLRCPHPKVNREDVA